MYVVVITVPKKMVGDFTDPNNYMPIVLVNVLSNLLINHQVRSIGSTSGVSLRAGTTNQSGAHELTFGLLRGSCCSIFSFLCSVLSVVVCF